MQDLIHRMMRTSCRITVQPVEPELMMLTRRLSMVKSCPASTDSHFNEPGASRACHSSISSQDPVSGFRQWSAELMPQIWLRLMVCAGSRLLLAVTSEPALVTPMMLRSTCEEQQVGPGRSCHASVHDRPIKQHWSSNICGWTGQACMTELFLYVWNDISSGRWFFTSC